MSWLFCLLLGLGVALPPAPRRSLLVIFLLMGVMVDPEIVLTVGRMVVALTGKMVALMGRMGEVLMVAALMGLRMVVER